MEIETLKQKQLKVLNDTIKAFNSTNRCTDEKGSCKYYVVNKQGCAIGRLIEDKELCKELDVRPNCGVSDDNTFHKLPLQLQDLTQDFLVELQNIHDCASCWDENGLTDIGYSRVKYIKTKFEL